MRSLISIVLLLMCFPVFAGSSKTSSQSKLPAPHNGGHRLQSHCKHNNHSRFGLHSNKHSKSNRNKNGKNNQNNSNDPNSSTPSNLAGLGGGLGGGTNGLGNNGFGNGDPGNAADSGIQSNAPAVAADANVALPGVDNPDDPSTAWITLHLPHPGSEVFLNGVRMSHVGNPRTYVTPPLDPALVYNYDVVVTWPSIIGGMLKYNITIAFTAGDEIEHVVPKEILKLLPPPIPNVEMVGPPIDDQEAKAQARLKLAKDLLKDKPLKGKEWLLGIVNKFPQTKAAVEARQLLGT